jgi:Flp pilus assembly protein TadG
MNRAALLSLAGDSRGVTALEFALIAPVLLTLVLGLFDLGHNMYTNTMLEGAIQQAARNSTIEGAAAQTASLDQTVTNAVRAIAPEATLQFSRAAYTSFSDVGQSEDFTDIDDDHTCNNGEVFEDANRNGVWDLDKGIIGQGGARDAVLYTVRVTYPRFFPIATVIPGQTDSFTMTAQTVLRNQPFDLQGSGNPPTGNCP